MMFIYGITVRNKDDKNNKKINVFSLKFKKFIFNLVFIMFLKNFILGKMINVIKIFYTLI